MGAKCNGGVFSVLGRRFYLFPSCSGGCKHQRLKKPVKFDHVSVAMYPTPFTVPPPPHTHPHTHTRPDGAQPPSSLFTPASSLSIRLPTPTMHFYPIFPPPPPPHHGGGRFVPPPDAKKAKKSAGTIHIMVKEGKKLSSANPYVKLYLSSDGRDVKGTKQKTKSAKKTNDPVFLE